MEDKYWDASQNMHVVKGPNTLLIRRVPNFGQPKKVYTSPKKNYISCLQSMTRTITTWWDRQSYLYHIEDFQVEDKCKKDNVTVTLYSFIYFHWSIRNDTWMGAASIYCRVIVNKGYDLSVTTKSAQRTTQLNCSYGDKWAVNPCSDNLTQGEQHKTWPWNSICLWMMVAGLLLKFPIKSCIQWWKDFDSTCFLIAMRLKFGDGHAINAEAKFNIAQSLQSDVDERQKNGKMPPKYREYLAVCPKQQSSLCAMWLSFLLILRGQPCIVCQAVNGSGSGRPI